MNLHNFTSLIAGAALAFSSMTAVAAGFSGDEVKIGVLTDLSGPYSGFSGPGSLAAVEMAVQDFGGAVNNKPVTVISADHLNKTDIGAGIARQWYDRDGVDAVFDISNSAVALAVMAVTKEKNRVVVLGGVSTKKATTEACTPNSIQYVYDVEAFPNVTGKALIKEGHKSWYFVTTDFAFGHGLEKMTREVVQAAGGKVLGSVLHPLNTTDFSSYMLQAQSSGAQVIGLATAGSDTVNAIKTANEFGVAQKQTLATLLTFISDVHSMGLEQAQGIVLTAPFYWDLNDETRAWSRRFFDKTGYMPTMVHAGMYSSVLHYLNAIKVEGSDDAQAVMARMKATPVNDFFAENGKIREDGLHVHDMYLLQVKTPEESKAPWDYYKVLSRVSSSEAFAPMQPGACGFIK
ncbi:MAG: ABC transporter substrate-binding protein [Pusillimonas sp.]